MNSPYDFLPHYMFPTNADDSLSLFQLTNKFIQIWGVLFCIGNMFFPADGFSCYFRAQSIQYQFSRQARSWKAKISVQLAVPTQFPVAGFPVCTVFFFI